MGWSVVCGYLMITVVLGRHGRQLCLTSNDSFTPRGDLHDAHGLPGAAFLRERTDHHDRFALSMRVFAEEYKQRRSVVVHSPISTAKIVLGKFVLMALCRCYCWRRRTIRRCCLGDPEIGVWIGGYAALLFCRFASICWHVV